MLLQIGEVGQRFGKKGEEGEVTNEVGDDCRGETREVKETTKEVQKTKKNTKEFDENWSISFEQFYASILTEASLVDEFSKRTDIEVGV